MSLHLRISINGESPLFESCTCVLLFKQMFVLMFLRYNEVREHAGDECSVTLVGNKLDQKDNRTVRSDVVQQYANEKHIQ
jgi:GTPase SAR1 family protein